MIDQMILAQTYWKRGNSELDFISIAVIGAGVLILLIYAFAKYGAGSKERRASGFNKAGFRRAAREAGLAEDEVRFMEEYARSSGLASPGSAFSTPERIDSLFKGAYRHIDKDSASEADAEELKARLFAARERISQGKTGSVAVASTRQLGKGMPLTFVAPGDESYPTAVIAVEQNGIAVEPVMDAYGEPIRFKRGSKLSCFFYAKGHQGFQFESRIVGWQKVGEREAMVIAHSEAVTGLPTRRHARREASLPCTFYRVRPGQAAAKAGTKSASGGGSRASVETLPFPGTAVDISAGGAGIRSANALAEGEFVKVEFELPGGVQAAFGRVIRMNRIKTRGGVMHVQFVKVPRKALNSILSYVYGYSE